MNITELFLDKLNGMNGLVYEAELIDGNGDFVDTIMKIERYSFDIDNCLITLSGKGFQKIISKEGKLKDISIGYKIIHLTAEEADDVLMNIPNKGDISTNPIFANDIANYLFN